MIIDSIENGIVIDHIKAGESMKISRYSGGLKSECTVAILKKRGKSKKKGRKDIIKISEDFDINLDAIGYIDPSITVNIIKDGEVHKNMPSPEKSQTWCIAKTRDALQQLNPNLTIYSNFATRKAAYTGAFTAKAGRTPIKHVKDKYHITKGISK